jgi:pimeloyl-ACP methyl ester carboxylesterase
MRDAKPAELTPTTPRIAFRRYGTSGPPVLFIMGFGVRGAAWTPQVQELERDHRIVAVDHRGVGSSPDAPRGPLTMRAMARDMVRVLDAVAWESAHVVGTSMGGMIAQELALVAPGRVRSLTLIATHAGGRRAVPSLRGLYLLGRSLLLPRRSLEQAYQLLYPKHYVTAENRTAILEHWRQIGRPARPPVLLAQAAAIARHDTRRRLRKVRAPTLVVRPGMDVLISPRWSDELAGAIPGARLLRFDDAGHGVTHQKAAELNRALRAHIGRAEQSVLAVAEASG